MPLLLSLFVIPWFSANILDIYCLRQLQTLTFDNSTRIGWVCFNERRTREDVMYVYFGHSSRNPSQWKMHSFATRTPILMTDSPLHKKCWSLLFSFVYFVFFGHHLRLVSFLFCDPVSTKGELSKHLRSPWSGLYSQLWHTTFPPHQHHHHQHHQHISLSVITVMFVQQSQSHHY